LAAGLLIGIGFGVLLIFTLRADGGSSQSESVSDSSMPVVTEMGSPAPDFELLSLDGEQVKLSDFKGKPVLINFWATWCGPCRLEMPLFQKYHDNYRDDLTILAINMGESIDEASAFASEEGLNLPILLDRMGVVEELYRVRGLPSTYFIDEKADIKFLHLGAVTEDQLLGYLDRLGVRE
jgi:thiol-disulfide isomerase/thioredoxin